jgi:hypothetical protein
MHNWQNTGRQNKLFSASITSNEQDTDISLCPFGCGQSENPQHYRQCSASPNLDESRICFRSIASWMKNALTHPVLQVLIIKAMKAWLQGDSPSAEDITLENEEYEYEIIQAHNTQDAIRWNNCFHTQAIHVVSY